MLNVFLRVVFHRGQQCLLIQFEPEEKLTKIVKSIEDISFSITLRGWYLIFTKEAVYTILELFQKVAFVDYTAVKEFSYTKIKLLKEKKAKITSPVADLPLLKESHILKIEKFKNYLEVRRYGDSTVKSYTEAIKVFLRYFREREISEITNEDCIEFNSNYILKNGYSSSYQNQIVNAIKLYFREVEKSAIDIDQLWRPKRAKTLPHVLNKEEIKQLLQCIGNLKHKCMLSLIYSCGLRCGELLSLKLMDIDSVRMMIFIREAKGKRDRIVPLSPKILELLRDYYKTVRTKVYLFEGQNEGDAYGSRSLQLVLKAAVAKAKIDKPVTLHWLRHSYATHLLDNGTDVRYIQELLGHKSLRTTEIYTHVSQRSIQGIISPFDTL